MSKLNFTADTIETTNNKNINIVSSTDTDSTYPSSKAVYESIKNFESVTNKKINTLTEADTDETYPSSKLVYNTINSLSNSVNVSLDAKENSSNKVTTLNNSSTDSTYPSSKAVYNAIKNLEKTENKLIENLTADNISDTSYPSTKAVYNSINNIINDTIDDYVIAKNNQSVFMNYGTPPTFTNSDEQITYFLSNQVSFRHTYVNSWDVLPSTNTWYVRTWASGLNEAWILLDAENITTSGTTSLDINGNCKVKISKRGIGLPKIVEEDPGTSIGYKMSSYDLFIETPTIFCAPLRGSGGSLACCQVDWVTTDRCQIVTWGPACETCVVVLRCIGI